MIEMGIIVGLGLLATLCKLPWVWKIRVLSHPLLMDAIVFTFLIAIHWGTFSGVMVATIGAFMCSIVLAAGKWLIGHTVKGVYKPGRFNIESKLCASKTSSPASKQAAG